MTANPGSLAQPEQLQSSGGLKAASILGYVKSRNEWPMLGVVIVNALNHVDHVLVVDHASSDMTPVGLEKLQQVWGDRITVVRLRDPAFFEEATVSVLMKACKVEKYDWVVSFDSDEFLLAGPDFALNSYLGGLSDDVEAVRYQVHNWLCPTDIELSRLGDHSNSFERALLSPPLDERIDIVEAVRNGKVNFFDLPFNSKLIARSKHAHLLTAGSHALRIQRMVVECSLAPSEMRCGHIPFYSKERLTLKARHGEYLAKAGYPIWYGWQSQLIYQIESEGNLDAFWEAHSILPSPKPLMFKAPQTCRDQALGQAIEGVLQSFDVAAMTSPLLEEMPAGITAESICFDSLIRYVDELYQEIASREQELAQRTRSMGSRIKSRLKSVISLMSGLMLFNSAGGPGG